MTVLKTPVPRLISADGAEALLPRDIQNRVERAWAVQAQIEVLKAELDTHKALLEKLLPAGGRAEIPGLCSATLSLATTTRIADAERLRGVLGPLWAECVIEEVAYKPTAALQQLASDGDSPIATPIRDCLTVSVTPRLTLRALRPEGDGKKAKKAK